MTQKVLIISSKSSHDEIFNQALGENFQLSFLDVLPTLPELVNKIITEGIQAVIVDMCNEPWDATNLVNAFKEKNDPFPFFVVTNEVEGPKSMNPFHVLMPGELFIKLFTAQLTAKIKNYENKKQNLESQFAVLKAKKLEDFTMREDVEFTQLDSELQKYSLSHIPLGTHEKPNSITKHLDSMIDITNKLLDKIKTDKGES